MQAQYFILSNRGKGWYAADRPHVSGNSGDQRHAGLFSCATTDDSGNFEIHTINPAGYPQSHLPAHIHIEVHGQKIYQPKITEFLFDDDERLKGTISSNAQRKGFFFKTRKANPPFQQQFSYTITLQKN